MTGFPLLSEIGQFKPGEMQINGSFNSLELPSLTAVGGVIFVTTSSPSFRCPSNITPQIVPYNDCVYCGYAEGAEQPSPMCNFGNPSEAPPTGVAATGTGATNTAAAKTTGAKASDAFALTHAGNSSIQRG